MTRTFFTTLTLAVALAAAPAVAQEKAPTGGIFTPPDDPKTQTLIQSGWNLVHADGCMSGDGYMGLFGRDGSTWFTFGPDDKTSMVLAASCQTGNIVGFHVTDVASGKWDAVFSVPRQ